MNILWIITQANGQGNLKIKTFSIKISHLFSTIIVSIGNTNVPYLRMYNSPMYQPYVNYRNINLRHSMIKYDRNDIYVIHSPLYKIYGDFFISIALTTLLSKKLCLHTFNGKFYSKLRITPSKYLFLWQSIFC